MNWHAGLVFLFVVALSLSFIYGLPLFIVYLAKERKSDLIKLIILTSLWIIIGYLIAIGVFK